MLANQDPYLLPDESGVDTLSLRRHLQSFREILEEKRWDTPRLRQQLLTQLQQRLVAAEVAKSTRQTAIQVNASDIILPIPPEARLSPIPGRSELLVLTKSPRVLRILDLPSNTLRPVEIDEQYFSEARVTSDGKHMLFGRFKGVLTKVPFDGKAKLVLLGLPQGVTAEEREITKDEKELKFNLKAAANAQAGQHRQLFVQFNLIKDGEPLVNTFAGGGILRVDKAAVAKKEEPKK